MISDDGDPPDPPNRVQRVCIMIKRHHPLPFVRQGYSGNQNPEPVALSVNMNMYLVDMPVVVRHDLLRI